MRAILLTLALAGAILVATPTASAVFCSATVCVETSGDHTGGGDGWFCVGFHVLGDAIGHVTCQKFT